ncbi:MAG: hypothetical protein OET90_02785 [Desulfuromonadales bacterium]|nr:hypothetical protein [Desulfuromonadales bacterium]
MMLKWMVTVFAVMVLSGCAATGGGEPVEKAPELVKLQCNSSYPHGCRHYGQIVAWDDWLEMQGHAPGSYSIKERTKSGSVTRFVLERKE